MVTKVYSQYCTGAPKDQLQAGEDRIITAGPLYPNMLDIIDKCGVHSATQRANEFIALHKIDLGDLRVWVSRALQYGTYINSQWCLGNSPKGLFACDSYVVSGELYNPQTRTCEITEVYVKVCITKTGSTIATMSFHPSY